jgi:hypothetical protein
MPRPPAHGRPSASVEALRRAPSRPRSSLRKWVDPVLVVIVALGLALRLRFMGEPMHYDEAFTFMTYARGSLGHIASTYDAPNNHILYTLLVHVTWRVLGDHVWTVRLPALLAGVTTIPAAYAAAAALYDRGAARWAAGLVATSAPLVDYSVNGRGYSLGVLLMLVALWLASVLVRAPSRWAWGGFVASSGLAVYAVPTMAYGIAAVALWLVATALAPPRDLRLAARSMAAVAGAGALALLLYAPVLGQPGWTVAQIIGWVDHPSFAQLCSSVWKNWNRAAPHPLDWLVAVGFVASLAAHRRIARHTIPIALPAVVSLAAALAFGGSSPYVRTWVYLLPFYLIAGGAGLNWVSRAAATRRAEAAAPLSAAAAAAVSVVLAAAFLHEGLRGADTQPASDNDLVGVLRRLVPQGQHALIDPNHVAVPAAYYLERDGGLPLTAHAVGGAERAAGHVVVVVRRAASPLAVVQAAGGTVAGRPRLVDRREWIDFYDVPLAQG